jgi:DhnA family fructose-bisphosphate aldolase class Ia
MGIEEAVRLNASLLAVMVAVGDKFEATTIRNLTRAVDMGTRYGIPTLGVTAVGKDMARDARYLAMASRVCAENGAHVVKTYFCDNFEQVTSTCPVPIVLAGGKKLPEFFDRRVNNELFRKIVMNELVSFLQSHVQKLTEGWPVGLHLVVLSLRGRNTV